MTVRSAWECSMATRMLEYIVQLSAFSFQLSAEEGLPQEPGVQGGDQDRHRPREREHPHRRRKAAHLALVTGELHQWKDRERQLQAQDHLAEDQQLTRASFAVEVHGDERGD